MKRILVLAFAGLIIASLGSPARAWDFSMKGEFEWQYTYISRTGPNDLFGNADAAQAVGIANAGTTIGLAGPNGPGLEVMVEGHSSKGADAAWNWQRMVIYPQIRLNKALRWRGAYSLSDVRLRTSNNLTGWHFGDSVDISGELPFASGEWRDSYLSAQLPWGIIAMGRRPGAWGPGWSTLHRADVKSRSVVVVAPYGPFAFIWSRYFHDSGENTAPGASNAPQPPNAVTGTIAPPSAWDQNEVRDWNTAYAVRYNAGNISTGALTRIVRYSNVQTNGVFNTQTLFDDRTQSLARLFLGVPLNGAIAAAGQHAFNPDLPMTGDIFFMMEVLYFQYNNGRFFFNAEYEFQYVDSTRKGGRPLSGRPQSWMLEFGTVIGPAKLSLAHFYRTGHDRRGGIFDTSSPLGTSVAGGVQVYDHFDFFIVFGGGDEAIKPYEFLMGWYGTGNNSYDSSGRPTFSDFVAYAARLDYAVAANLNLFSSFIWAARQSGTGTPWGMYDGQLGGSTTLLQAGILPNSTVRVPNVPDDYLGWEWDIGLNWKLLEGLTFNALFAYWQPGDWFKYAYLDNSTTATVPLPGGGPTAVRSNWLRAIDPLIAVQGSMIMEF